MREATSILQRLGFGEYEARAYMGLLHRAPMTGYELAKVSGVPKANVYDILPRLEERGAVVRVDSPTGARYTAVAPAELMPRLSGRFHDDLAAAEEALDSGGDTGEQEQEGEYAWNVEGYRSVVDHARALLGAAQSDLLVALWSQEAAVLAGALSDAELRGISIRTLCLAACDHECGGCRGSIHRYRLAPEGARRWLVVVVDGKEMLAAQLGSEEVASAVRTTQPLLVELAGWYVRNSIALATLVTDLGERMPQMLSAEAASVLASLGRSGQDGGWLEQMLEAVSRPGLRL